MFFRRKVSGGFEYLQIVKSERADSKPRQSVDATLGGVDTLARTGAFDPGFISEHPAGLQRQSIGNV